MNLLSGNKIDGIGFLDYYEIDMKNHLNYLIYQVIILDEINH